MVTKKKRAVKRRQRLRGKRRSRRRMDPKVGDEVARYAQLVMDPCMGPLVRAPGLADSVPIVERQRLTFTANANGYAQGYVVWLPAFHGAGFTGGGAYMPQNCLLFEPTSTTVNPTNTSTYPMGTASLGSTYAACGGWQKDPAWDQIDSGVFSRARTIAACMQLEYLGSLSSAAGQVAMVANMSWDALTKSTAGSLSGAPIFPTVDQIFAYAGSRERLDLAGHEVVFRPSDLDAKLRGPSELYQGYTHAHGTVADAVLWGGSASAGVATHQGTTDVNNSTAIVIAWRGMPTTASTLVVNLVKVSEYELAPTGAMVEQPHAPVGYTDGSSSTISKVVELISQTKPSWQRGTVVKAVDALMRVTNAVRAFTAGRASTSQVSNRRLAIRDL